MNDYRREVCQQAFRHLDFADDGIIDLSDIKRKYNAKKHPDVVSGRRTEDEILCEFLDTFEAHYAMMHGKQTKDRRISMKEWLEYYNNVSCNIDNDEYFALMMQNAYSL